MTEILKAVEKFKIFQNKGSRKALEPGIWRKNLHRYSGFDKFENGNAWNSLIHINGSPYLKI